MSASAAAPLLRVHLDCQAIEVRGVRMPEPEYRKMEDAVRRILTED